MGSVDDISQLCRLCLVKDQVNIPIFDGSSEIGQTFVKINSCLPVKVSRDDNLPKKICDGCSYKLDMLYIFRNTSVDSEKQLISWLSQSGLSTISQAAAKDPLANAKPEIMVKQETFDSADSRVEGDNPDMGVDAQNYILQQQQLPYQQDFEFGEPSGSIAEMTDEPTPKRAKRAAALKKAPIEDIEETEDDLDAAMQITKAEEEDSEDVDQPDYVEAPSTSADDQPGPSGVGKAPVEAPRLMLKRELKHFECGVCSQFFGSFDEYSFHVNNSHDELLTPDSGLLGIQFADIKSLIPKTDTEFIIDKSSDEETTEWDQIEVFTSKQPEKWSCDICNKILNSRTSFYRHRVGHSESKKPCPYCTGYFNRYTLKQHIQTIHLNKKNFVCDTCNYATVNKYFLEKHIIQQHTKTYPFPCNVCGRGFIKQSMLDDHHHREHREGVIHVCDECGKTFKTDASLRKHRKLHDPSLKKKEKPMCEICGEKFMYLQEHVRKMHGGTKSKMCEFCGKGFHTKNQLNMHMMRKHTGEKRFRCSFCFHGVVTKSELDEHIRRRHSDTESIEDVRDKPFQCSLCKKRFKIRGSLTDHMRKHSGEKAYSCDVCQEKFISKHYLKFHRCSGLSEQLLNVSSN